MGNSKSHLCYVVRICQFNFSQLLCCKQSFEIAAGTELRQLHVKKKPCHIPEINVLQKLLVIAIQFCEHE